MHTFAQRSRANQQSTPVNSLLVGRCLRQSIGNGQAYQGEPRDAVAPKPFGHDFSRVRIHSEPSPKLQPKLAISAPGDIYEREADNISKAVVSMPEPGPKLSCACGGQCPKCEPKNLQNYPPLQTKRVQPGGTVPTAAPPIVTEVLGESGQPLNLSTREFMERRFGHDFGQVRVHIGAKAAESANALDALAYTVGRDTVFNTGQYQPNTSDGRQLLAHELSHTIQQGAATPLAYGSERSAITSSRTYPLIQRAMKFELQTENVLWRVGGKGRRALPRKFGPTDQRFLHKGTKGKPAKPGEEGTAVELQSETHGYVEFETPSWLRNWCEVKERIQEAADMVDEIDKSTVVSTTGGIKTMEFPFSASHLMKTKAFPTGLKAGEEIHVEILDPSWTAGIQASESFELSQFESYLGEHLGSATFTSISDTAKKIRDDANTAKLPDKDLVKLLNFLEIIIEHITQAQKWNTDEPVAAERGHLAKENISLMSRTNFSSMFGQLLSKDESKDEQKLFRDIVKSGAILKELGLSRRTLVFPSGFTGRKSPGPRIHEWLVSIYSEKRDLLSSLGGDNRAMGRFDVDPTPGKKDTNLVKFEARSTSHQQVRSGLDLKVPFFGVVVPSGWVAFAEEVFKAASTNRARTGSTELIYEPKKCP